MALQTDEFGLAVLGVAGDVPGTPHQPPLIDGIHLRWSPGPGRGFPWHGYYLFRRKHKGNGRVCASPSLAAIPPGRIEDLPLETAFGAWRSDRALAIRGNPDTGIELDLAGRGWIECRLPAARTAWRATATIAFRHPWGRSYTPEAPGPRANPLDDGTVRVEGRDGAALRPALALVEVAGDVGIECGGRLDLQLPDTVDGIGLELRSPSTAVKVTCLDGAGVAIASSTTPAGPGVLAPFLIAPGTRTIRIAGGPGTVLHGFSPTGGPGAAIAQHVPLAGRGGTGGELRQLVSGLAGDVVTVTLDGPAFARVRIGGAIAGLRELCVLPVAVEAGEDWEPVYGFPYPLALPVAHADYPCAGAATDPAAAEAMALGRVRYGDPQLWAGSSFQELHASLEELVEGGPAGPPMADRGGPVASADGPRLVRRRPLDLVLAASLQPALAQALGLYFVDEKVSPGSGTPFDYLIVADHEGYLGGSAASALAWIEANPSFGGVDAWIHVGATAVGAGPLAAPQGALVHALPGGTAAEPGGALRIADGMAGLRWDLPLDETGALRPGSAVAYHLWRADLGSAEPAGVPPLASYERLESAPLVVARAQGPLAHAADWPPHRLLAIDGALAEGWYSYRASGVDVFGRHSALSEPAAWWQWAPVPVPRPWYQQAPDVDLEVHAYAVRILDTAGPPAPVLLDAAALDPADPTVLRDARYTAWRAALPAAVRDQLVGLRVRWRWTSAHRRAAPDTAEFRIYDREGRFNLLPCAITSVVAESAETSLAITDLPAAPPDALAGAILRGAAGGHRVLGSSGAPLALRVANLGAARDVRPARGGAAVSIAGLPAHPQHREPSARGSWPRRLHAVPLSAAVADEVTPLDVGGAPLTGTAGVATAGALALDGAPLLAAVVPGLHALAVLEPSGATRSIHEIAAAGAGMVQVMPPVVAAQPVRWAIGLRTWTYDVLLPVPTAVPLEGLSLAPTLAAPIAHAQVGVSAADARPHAADDPRFGPAPLGQRPGNEGAVAGPAAIFRVRREPPPAPVAVADGPALVASAADYHGRSYFSFRWRPLAHACAHVLRALDEAVFAADRALRPRPPLSPSDPVFPAAAVEPAWTAGRRAQVAAELAALDAFPPTEAGERAARAAYRALSNDGVRILASLPGVERAFVQRTAAPLDPGDPAVANRRGPDDPAGWVPDPALRVFVDTLDGRARNRYLYRAAYVDGAHNRSALGTAGPPVVLPPVAPPRAPVLSEARAGGAAGALDGAVSLRWRASREPALAGYRVYRAAAGAAAAGTIDLRAMALVAELPVAAEPAARPRELSWTDTALAAGTYHYRLAAFDSHGNASPASPAAVVRPVVDPRPAPPSWGPVQVDAAGAASLSWTLADPQHAVLVERALVGAPSWQRVGGWLARGATAVVDAARAPGAVFAYRLRVLDAAGRQNRTFSTVTL